MSIDHDHAARSCTITIMPRAMPSRADSASRHAGRGRRSRHRSHRAGRAEADAEVRRTTHDASTRSTRSKTRPMPTTRRTPSMRTASSRARSTTITAPRRKATSRRRRRRRRRGGRGGSRRIRRRRRRAGGSAGARLPPAPPVQDPGSHQAPPGDAGAGGQGRARQQGRGADDLSVAGRPLCRADAQHRARRRHQPQDHLARRTVRG